MAHELKSAHGTGIGGDPELFIVEDLPSGRVRAVPSERVLPDFVSGEPQYAAVVRDGVQAEIRVGGNGTSCRQSLACNIHSAIITLNNLIEKHNATHGTKYRLSFTQMVRLTKAELASISPESRQLNCKPSLNAYGREDVKRNGDTYLLRSGSGHLHFSNALVKSGVDPAAIVKILDVVVGIPCVLLARSPAEAHRRRSYGRAGEYRLPPHGLEYRTPSNFWLAHYQLQSMIYGIARMGLNIAEGLKKSGYNKWAVDIIKAGATEAEVEKAINTNNFESAMTIYQNALRPALVEHNNFYGPLHANNIRAFEYLVEAGLPSFFDLTDKGITRFWTEQFTYNTGWERFLDHTVKPKIPSTFTGFGPEAASAATAEPLAKAA